jgi:hypothetical protein
LLSIGGFSFGICTGFKEYLYPPAIEHGLMTIQVLMLINEQINAFISNNLHTPLLSKGGAVEQKCYYQNK